jgi:hypothetical protein
MELRQKLGAFESHGRTIQLPAGPESCDKLEPRVPYFSAKRANLCN